MFSQTAVILSSIEDTLREQNAPLTGTAYFAALLSLLKQDARAEKITELDAATIYLLDIVTSHVPPALLRSQFSSIVTTLGPYLNSECSTNTDSSITRAAIGCLESILIAQDAAAWSLPGSQISSRQALTALLPLALATQPKTRKRASDAIKNILTNPPPGPAIDHPAAELCAVAAQNNLKNAVQIVHQNRKQGKQTKDASDPSIIHALYLTKTVAIASGGWPSKKIEALCEILLSISRSKNDYLVMSAFEVFEVIFEGMQDELSSAKLPRLLEAITELKPGQNDIQLLPAWIAILSRGYGAYAAVEPEEVFARLPDLINLVSEFLTNTAHNVRVSASECLISFFANCVPVSVVLEPSIYDEKILKQIADRSLGLLSVKYQTAWMEVFGVLSAAFDALRHRGDPYLLLIVQTVGELRSNSAFQGKKDADEVLGHAIRALGPAAVLKVLPLNLVKPRKAEQGRAWLLPLLRDNVTNTTLQHFKDELLPLSENMYQRVLNHGKAEKTMDIKVFETVVQQVWSTLPGYCDLPIDLQIAVDQRFAELLSNLLYQQAELRADVCRALQNLVESNQAVIDSDADDETLRFEHQLRRADAQANLVHLGRLSSNLLAVLFNVYSQTLPQSRAYILQCINAYLSITPEQDLVETFERVSTMLDSELPRADSQALPKQPLQPNRLHMPPTSHTLLDLIIALSVHLPRSSFAALFTMASSILTNPSIIKSDPQLVKKAYKLIPRLANSESGRQALSARSAELQQLFLRTAASTPVPARRDRTLAIKTLLGSLAVSDLHFIPCIISEIVLACKDTNEKARTAGFETLFLCARTITNAPPGTTIRTSLVPHIPDDAPNAAASTEEAFTMVSAGLAGVAPHMVAATITALSALLFEYNGDESLSTKMKEELSDTVAMFLQSNNREIVRAVLGYVKVMVVVFPLDALESRMPEIVPGLLVWSKENKGRLKAKVKNILDRLVRRFGGGKVEEWAGPDAKRLIVNIRKARERARRKKQTAGEDDSEEEGDTKSRTYDNEFDEAVYGSDDEASEVDGDDSGSDAMSGVTFKTGKSGKSGKSAKRGRDKEQFIRQDDSDEEPLDLLDPKAMSAISSSRKSSHKLNGNVAQRQTKAKTNEDGKLVFNGRDDSGDELNIEPNHSNNKENGAIDAYVDAVSGPHAVQRGQKGRLKVKSGMQKGSRAELKKRDGDEEMLDVEQAREVARKIMQGSSTSRLDSKTGSNNPRRTLTGEKLRPGSSGSVSGSGSGGIQKRRSKSGPGQRGVRFSSHPARRSQVRKR